MHKYKVDFDKWGWHVGLHVCLRWFWVFKLDDTASQNYITLQKGEQQ